jgi:AcrR family transcriptional regulator
LCAIVGHAGRRGNAGRALAPPFDPIEAWRDPVAVLAGLCHKPRMTAGTRLLKPKRGRPSAARAEAIDQQIIAVARNMFLSDGFDLVSMEQVAATAKVSKGTLYARHPSKEALFAAVIEAAVDEWSEESSRHDHLLTDDIAQRLRHHAWAIIQSMRRPDVVAFQQLTLSLRDRFPAAARAMHESGYRYIVDFIARDVTAAAERDGIPARAPGAVAELLVASITGKQMQDGQCGEELRGFADRVVDILIAAREHW